MSPKFSLETKQSLVTDMIKENGRLLFIVDSLPPDKGGRVEKIVRRLNYLSNNHWFINVLAPKAEHEGQEATSGILNQNQNLHVTRTNYLFRRKYPSLRHNKNRSLNLDQSQKSSILDFLFVPKGFIRWFPYAIYHGVKIARKSDVILSINNPIMLHLVGLVVSKLTRKPWVVELRDPIVGYAYSRRGPEFLNSWLERLIFQNADKIIRFEDSMPIGISQRYPHLSPSQFVSIEYMGYEKEDFTSFGFLESIDYKEKLKIAYTGSFYGDTITPIPFLKALNVFLQREPQTRDKIVVNFAGDWAKFYDVEIQKLQLDGIVKYLGYLSREECLNLWRESQVQLLILGKEEDNINRIPSKFYDYVGAKRPILALVHPEGKVARLIHQENLGFVADTVDVEAIAEQLSLIFSHYEKRKLGGEQNSLFRNELISDNSEQVIAETLHSLIRPASK